MKHPNMPLPPVKNTRCAAFEEYKEVTETVPLDFSKDNATWVVSKRSGATGELGAEAIKLSNFILCSGCVSKEFRIVVANMDNWVSNSPPHGLLNVL